MHWCYIIYSPSINKFYVGETKDLELRITQHNTAFFEHSYTSRTSDWSLYVSLSCIDRAHARKVESFIKKMKSKEFIINLKGNIDMQASITNRFK